jgi:CRISPR-associated exonuclease Cas4
VRVLLGGRNFKAIIEKAIDGKYESLITKIDKTNPDRVHAIEAVNCTRLAYYDRKDPLPSDSSDKISIFLGHGMRKSLGNKRAEYKIDSFTLEVDVDMVIADEFVARFEVTPTLPEVPNPRHMLYLNACLFALEKQEGFLIYITADGKTVEFSISKNNRMFEETMRRARVLSTLLKDGKVPIVEPGEFCMTCKYFERCYMRDKGRGSNSNLLEEIFGKDGK